MTNSEFKIKIKELTGLLLNDGKLIINDIINIKIKKPSSLYRMKTCIDYIISNYNIAKELLPDCISKDELKYCIINEDCPHNHICPVCGKQIKFNGIDYDITCRSKSCLCNLLLNNPDISDRHQYIKDSYLNGNLEFSDIQIGFIEKYRVYNNSQLSQWRDEMRCTWKNKSAEDLQKTNEKRKSTCKEKYGYDFSQQNPDIIEKQKVTWKSKTEEDHKIAAEKRKQTCIGKYGVDHVMKYDEFVQNIKNTFIEHYGCNHWLRQKVNHKDLYCNDDALREFVIEKYNNNNYKKVQKKYYDEFFNINVTHRFEQLNLFKYVKKQESSLENLIKELLDNNNIFYKHHNRSVVDGINGEHHKYELDFLLSDHNIAIEINDIATHNADRLSSNKFGKNYHLYKTLNCKEKNIRLIHIWECELHNNFDKLSKWLINELNDNKQRIFARNCIIKQISVSDEKTFLNEYHLQGYAKSTVAYGLYFNDELIQIMTFGEPRFSKKYEYELIRLCTKYNYIIIGGVQRLFNKFIKEYNPTSIISYCDFSKFSGSIYEKIGMKYVNRSKPTVMYCNYKWNTINESILIKEPDTKELVQKDGYLPIYNCGNLIYEWKSK